MRKIQHLIRHNIKKEDGQSMVEFALILPLLLLILCGIIEFGLYINVKLTLNTCARESVRYAAIHSDETDIEDILEEQVSQYPALTCVEVSVHYSDYTHRRGDVTVRVSAEYYSVTPIGLLFLGGNRTVISSELTMRVE